MLHQIRWTSKKIASRLTLVEAQVYRRREPIPNFIKGDTGDEVPPNSYWAGPREEFALRSEFRIPPSWDGATPIGIYLPIGVAGDFSHPEALVHIDGESYAACDRHHQEIILPEKWCDGESHELVLHGWTGIGGSTVGDPTKKLLMKPCEVVQIDQPTRDFVALARVSLGIADQLDDNNPIRHHLYTALNDAFNALDLRVPVGDAFYASVPVAAEILREGIEHAGPPLDVDITAVGHAHIDVAWLWTLAVTRLKSRNTFHTVLRLMEQFPDYRFVQSQPQLYDYVKQDDPALFDAIKALVAADRWEPIGGMWVEADCNLSGGESLARQFLLGRSFFREHFREGTDSPVLWLPDVFGYAWNLPQLIKEAGLEYFFTIKIGWSQYNRLPYDSFWWQGLDGTRVLTHFSTTKDPGSVHASTYNANASPGQTLGTWFNFQQKDYGPPGTVPPLLMSYGWGDGGGGPTREMLENIREMGHFSATPQIHTGKVGEFFQKLDEEVGDRLPTWNGELYLEYHRGTYTTQARNKRANRKSEFLLHDAEFLAAYASLLDSNYQYPISSLTKAWELVCLNQFHDIIPGSSIGPVYDELLEQYEAVREIGEEARDEALKVIVGHFGGDLLIVNPTSFPRSDLAFAPLTPALSPKAERRGGPGSDALRLYKPDGSLLNAQAIEGGFLLDLGELPPYSITPLTSKSSSPLSQRGRGAGASPEPSRRGGGENYLLAYPTLLENPFLLVEFSPSGDITRLYDKANDREILPAGAIANQFQAFEDRPLSWDAWDIDIFYDDKMWLADPAASVKVVEEGPLRATLEIRRKVLNSEITQRISLTHNSPRLDFDTTIEWNERCILLKVAFPVDVLTPVATYEIQWGNVQRPTHRNTSWDWARFETAAQKWVDLSEGDYGVSMLNDCKYGHDIRDNVMRLTLLRSTTAPDPDADKGQHQFAYSLFPHAGSWDETTIAAAYALNDPLLVFNPNTQYAIRNTFKEPPSVVSVDQPNVIIETIKRAEDGNGLILRLYESQRKRGSFTLSSTFPLAKAWRANLLEENLEVLSVDGNLVKLSIRPYQIMTLRLLPAV